MGTPQQRIGELEAEGKSEPEARRMVFGGMRHRIGPRKKGPRRIVNPHAPSRRFNLHRQTSSPSTSTRRPAIPAPQPQSERQHEAMAERRRHEVRELRDRERLSRADQAFVRAARQSGEDVAREIRAALKQGSREAWEEAHPEGAAHLHRLESHLNSLYEEREAAQMQAVYLRERDREVKSLIAGSLNRPKSDTRGRKFLGSELRGLPGWVWVKGGKGGQAWDELVESVGRHFPDLEDEGTLNDELHAWGGWREGLARQRREADQEIRQVKRELRGLAA